MLRAPKFRKSPQFFNVVITELLGRAQERVDFLISLGMNILLGEKIENGFAEKPCKTL